MVTTIVSPLNFVCMLIDNHVKRHVSYKDSFDTFCDDLGCTRLYATYPLKVCNVIDICHILGLAPITRDPLNPTIPAGSQSDQPGPMTEVGGS